MRIKVKNMVCDRCKQVLMTEFTKAGMTVDHIELGEIELGESARNEVGKIEQILAQNGFEWVKGEDEALIVSTKKYLIEVLDRDMDRKLSEYLSARMGRDYSVISKLFSTHEGITIEKFLIRMKIERAKERIQMGDRTFSEIAYELGYKSSSHLAKQFKAVTGMSMGEYRKLPHKDRKPWDRIV